MLDPDLCYRALRTHDERFDGRFFVGVTSTGIYCRPVCPASPAKRESCRFFATAAAAQEAGFRPCLRCRPEAAPDTASWRGSSTTVSRGLALFQRAPSALRRKAVASLREGTVGESGVVVRLRYRPPFDWGAILTHLRARAVDGVERVTVGTYARTVEHEGRFGTVEVAHLPDARCLAVTIRLPSVAALPAIVRRVRRVFDLGADVALIGAHLAKDPWLAPLVSARPGLRVPGGWDGFELAARAVYGQQITVEAARRIGGRLVELCGARVDGGGELRRAFPSAAAVAKADLTRIGLTFARARALEGLARAALADSSLFEPLDSIEATVARLAALHGIGAWTAHYIALRAARDPDAFPASDVGLLRGATREGAERPTPAALLARAERWRPWRAYAAQHLWAKDALVG